ncbi:MAG: hypothetical protein NTZ05_19045 [Chloroflexi bacterium]|nr:hypothetical protein [Chloroflexota bacterium]
MLVSRWTRPAKLFLVGLMIPLVIASAALPSWTVRGAPLPATTTLSQALTFSTTGQPIWTSTPGGALPVGDVTWRLSNAPWGPNTPNGEQYTKSVSTVTGPTAISCPDLNPANCTVSNSSAIIGGDLYTKSGGHFRVNGATKNLQGTVGVTYPGTATLNYPSGGSFNAGDTVTIGSSWAQSAGGVINAGETRGDLTLTTDIRISGAFIPGVFLPGITEATTIYDFDESVTGAPVFSMAANDSIPSIPPVLGIGGDLGSVSVKPVTVSGGNGTIVAQGTKRYSNIIFDFDGIASTGLAVAGAFTKFKAAEAAKKTGAAAAKTNGYTRTALGLGLLGKGLTDDSWGVDIAFDIVDADGVVEMYADQTLTFKGDVYVRLDFSRPVGAITGAYQSKDPANSWVVYKAGTPIDVTFPSGNTNPIIVTPTASLNNQFTNKTSLRSLSSVKVQAGRFALKFPRFTVFPRIGGWELATVEYWVPNISWVDAVVNQCVLGVCVNVTICTACVPMDNGHCPTTWRTKPLRWAVSPPNRCPPSPCNPPCPRPRPSPPSPRWWKARRERTAGMCRMCRSRGR